MGPPPPTSSSPEPTGDSEQTPGANTSQVEPVHDDDSNIMDYLRVTDATREELSGIMEENDLTEALLSPTDSNNQPAEPSHPISMASQYIRRAGHFLGYITLLTMLFLIPFVLYMAIHKKRADLAAFHSAEVMVVGTIIMSIRLVYLHVTHWNMPDAQKYVVRILWMVPLYSFQSWLSLRFHHSRIYMEAIRDLYEAFVIQSFVYYLIELLGGQDSLVRILERKEDRSLGEHPIPFYYVLKEWQLGMEFMLQCKHGVLQYVVVKTVATLLTVNFEWMGIFGEGHFAPNVAYPYMAFFMNISVMYALYCLVKLFYAVNEELCNPINWRPLGKFLCIKGVVMFTWWQGVIIFYLRAHGFIEDVDDWKADDVAYGLIDYCICIEMVFFAIAHSYTFTYKEYLPSRFENLNDTPMPRMADRPVRPRDALWSSTVPRETLTDIRRMRRGVSHQLNAETATPTPGAISLQQVIGSYEETTTEDAGDDEQEQKTTLIV